MRLPARMPWVISVALLAFPVTVEAATIKDFRYAANLPNSLKPDQLYQVHLSSDLIKESHSDFSDLRIMDRDGKEVPFVVLENAFSPVPAKTYELTVKKYESRTGSATLTLEMPKDHEPIDRIDLDITGQDFTKRATVSGSNNGRSWHRLAEDPIYDFSSQVILRKTFVEFADTDQRYFLIKLTDESPPKSPDRSIHLSYDGLDFSANDMKAGKLKINRVRGSAAARKANPDVYDEVSFENIQSSRDDKGRTIILLGAGLPIERIEFTVARPSYYYRNVQVFTSETGKEDSFRLLTQGVIYRFPLGRTDQQNNKIEYSSGKHLFYRVVVENGDNPPLEISTVKFRWIRKNLYFVATSGEGPYRIYVGGVDRNRPDYDLSKFIRQDNWSEQPFIPIATEPLRNNGAYRPVGQRIDRARVEKAVLIFVILIIGAGLTYWMYSLLKRPSN
jgi:Protein of unknown function (DUF3999)